MISTSKRKKGLSPEERKSVVAELRKEHEDYFKSIDSPNALYIPKMAYRPSGKDELHIGFFPSEMNKNADIYTEFVSIDYVSEDPKRTLYLLKFNPHWEEEYELITSNAGFERHIIPVSELKVINDINSRNNIEEKIQELSNYELPSPEDRDLIDVLKGIEKALTGIYTVLNNRIK
tara:strand:- start:5780 stop:6307 length:528 start_codon:yes stop_codon:yes gene_type:complete